MLWILETFFGPFENLNPKSGPLHTLPIDIYEKFASSIKISGSKYIMLILIQVLQNFYLQ